MKHRLTAAPRSLVQRVWRFLFTYHRPEPARLAPALAQTGGTLLDTITTVAVSLAALRKARPDHQETTP